MGIVQGADAIDDVDRADKHEQDCCERRTSSTSHLLLLSDRAAPLQSLCAGVGRLFKVTVTQELGRDVIRKG
jgi:hypothetical protein